MEETPNLALPYILPSQAQKHVTHNEALRLLDAIVQVSVVSRAPTEPPSDPADGDRYIVGTPAEGEWEGWEDSIACFVDDAWMEIAPRTGWRSWIEDEETIAVFDGEAWTTIGAGGLDGGGGDAAFETIGVLTDPDPANRLSVKSDAVLLSHDDETPGTGDMRLKLNKTSAGATASIVFQCAFSGRAEAGLAGDDDFRLKVSPDGSTWKDAIVVNGTTGGVAFPNTPGSGAPDMFYVEQHANGTSVSGTVDAWNKRSLNQEQRDVRGEGSLASGVLTLAAGEYYAEAWSTCHRVGRHKLRLRRTSGTPATLVVGSTMNAQDINNVTNMGHLAGFFTVSAASTVELQHFIDDNGAGTNHLGVGSTTENVEPEVFACLKLWRVA